MSGQSPVSRRTALAGLGAGSLGMLLGSNAAALPIVANRETGGAPGGEIPPMAQHALTGRWLAMIGLPSNEDMTVAVPTALSADGTAMMIFPGTEAARRGLEIKGVAVGDWEPVSETAGHFTVVQVLSNLNGQYVGTVTVDGEAMLSDDGLSFSVKSNDTFFTVRNQFNEIVEHLATSVVNPMRGFRMRAGNAGFPDTPLPRRKNDPRSPY